MSPGIEDRGTRRYCGAVLLAGVVSLVLTHQAPTGNLFLPALLALHAELRAHYIPGYGALNFAEGIYLAVALQHGPAAWLAAAVGVVADHAHKKAPNVKIFNLGWALTTFSWTGKAAALYDPALPAWAPHNLAALLGALLMYGLLTSLLQAGAQAFMERMPLRRTLAQQSRLLRLSLPGAGFLALLANYSLLLVFFPVEIFSAYARLREAHGELKATQARLVAAERQAGLVVLAAGVAHEINNPLTAIQTSLFMLKRSCDGPALQLAQEACHQARDVVERMLRYSRAAPAGAPGELLRAVEDARLFLTHRGSFSLELGLEGLPPVACSPPELVQVFSNLLSNALDAGATQITVEGGRAGERVWVRISDNGSGIPAGIQKHIFDPFFTTRPVGQGTGLGLSIVAGLLTGCGGKLELESSQPGRTAFLLSFRPA